MKYILRNESLVNNTYFYISCDATHWMTTIRLNDVMAFDTENDAKYYLGSKQPITRFSIIEITEKELFKAKLAGT